MARTRRTESHPDPAPEGDSPHRRVVLRDLLIFQLKLGLDGIKDMVLSPLSIGAALLDFLLGPTRKGPRLYGVLRLGERFDLWLNPYGAAELAGRHREGLYGVSRAGSDTLLGRLELWSRGGTEEEEDSAPGPDDRSSPR